MTERIKVTWPTHMAGMTGEVVNWPTSETANIILDNEEKGIVMHRDNFEIVENARVWGEWFGGSGYAMSYPWEYLETFESLEAAKDALLDRYSSRGPHDFAYVNRESDCTETPGVGEDCEMWVFYSDPMTEDMNTVEHYPDAIIRLAFEGDVNPVAVVESC